VCSKVVQENCCRDLYVKYGFFLNKTSEFNAVDSVVKELGHAYQGRTFSDAWEKFWPDALPAATSDSYRYQRELNPGLLVARPSDLTPSQAAPFFLNNKKKRNKKIKPTKVIFHSV